MAFEVQNPDVPTATANAYISVAYFQAFCDDRGIDYSAKTDTQIQQAIVRATDYMDGRWTYAGVKYDEDQSTECPRKNVWDRRGLSITGFPRTFLLAACEYTKTDLIDGKTLMPDPDNSNTSHLTYYRRKADEVEQEKRWSDTKGYQWPRWALADKLLRQSGLLTSQRRTLDRG